MAASGSARPVRRLSLAAGRATRFTALYGTDGMGPSLTMTSLSARLASAASLLLLTACSPAAPPVAAAPDVDWPFYGGDAGGQRYSTAAQITPANVRHL